MNYNFVGDGKRQAHYNPAGLTFPELWHTGQVVCIAIANGLPGCRLLQGRTDANPKA